MKQVDAMFVKSSARYQDCPEANLPEYAFIGRSNVGKSSLINMLTHRKNLAKTSSKPGKTQLINHFLVNDNWYMVDLPGYGWSKVSKKLKASWGVMIEDYLLKRENLSCLFILLDGRHEPQKIDYDFIQWVGEQGIPIALVFTKIDKLSKNQFQAVKAKHTKALKAAFTELPKVFSTSAEKNIGAEELIVFVEKVNKVYRKSE